MGGSVHLYFSSSLIAGSDHPLTLSPLPSLPSALSGMCSFGVLDQPPLTCNCPGYPLPVPQQIRPLPLLPGPRGFCQTSTPSNIKGILQGPLIIIASPTWVRDGFRCILVADATTSGAQAVLGYHLLKVSPLLLGCLC